MHNQVVESLHVYHTDKENIQSISEDIYSSSQEVKYESHQWSRSLLNVEYDTFMLTFTSSFCRGNEESCYYSKNNGRKLSNLSYANGDKSPKIIAIVKISREFIRKAARS